MGEALWLWLVIESRIAPGERLLGPGGLALFDRVLDAVIMLLDRRNNGLSDEMSEC